MIRPPQTIALTLFALATFSLSACGTSATAPGSSPSATGAAESATAPSVPATPLPSTDLPKNAPESPLASSSPQVNTPADNPSDAVSSPQAAIDPNKEPDPTVTAADLEYNSLPATLKDANISVFKAEITQVSYGSIETTQGRMQPGSPAIKATIKLTNLSDSPVNADALSFPVLNTPAGSIAGNADTLDPASALFGTIEAGSSKEITVAFPTDEKLTTAQISLTDPANPATSVELTHAVAER